MKTKPTKAELMKAADEARVRVSGYSNKKRKRLNKRVRELKQQHTTPYKMSEFMKENRRLREEVQELRQLDNLATKVSNDISEGIDCGETRKQLRDCISWWADLAATEARQRARYESALNLIKAGVAMAAAGIKK